MFSDRHLEPAGSTEQRERRLGHNSFALAHGSIVLTVATFSTAPASQFAE
jgi:hypothetical protein